MATFVENIWESIFTPGPTPTLVVATNATFACLQLVFAVLLFLTYSIHFIVLSFLCAGLWVSINWFAREVLVAQAEQEAKRRGEEASARQSRKDGADLADSGDAGAMDSGDDTETEMDETRKNVTVFPPRVSSARAGESFTTGAAGTAISAGQFNTSAASRLAPSEADDGIRQRRNLAESTGDVSSASTDSEWEKVDDER